MVLGLKQTPDYTTFYRFMRRLDENLIQNALQEAALQIMNNQPTRNVILAVDATGLAPGVISTFFINCKRDRGQRLPWRYWLKWVVVWKLNTSYCWLKLLNEVPTMIARCYDPWWILLIKLRSPHTFWQTRNLTANETIRTSEKFTT
jgi:hypothetical protein